MHPDRLRASLFFFDQAIGHDQWVFVVAVSRSRSGGGLGAGARTSSRTAEGGKDLLLDQLLLIVALVLLADRVRTCLKKVRLPESDVPIEIERIV